MDRHVIAAAPLGALVLAGLIASTGRSEDDGPAAAAGRAAEMKQIAGSLSAVQGRGADRHPVGLRRGPLLRWNDPTRDFSDASLWAWGEPGRPVALVSLELYPEPSAGAGATKWAYEFISLSTGPLEVHGGERPREPLPSPTDRIHWSPAKPGVTFREFPAAPVPVTSATGRLAQMKDLLKRLTCTAHPGRAVTLRLMTHPVVRYADASTELIDGAVFAFASGTNPEVLVLLEAHGPSPGEASWHYAIARLTAAPFDVALDRREILSEPYNPGSRNPDEPYYTLHLPRHAPTPSVTP